MGPVAHRRALHLQWRGSELNSRRVHQNVSSIGWIARLRRVGLGSIPSTFIRAIFQQSRILGLEPGDACANHAGPTKGLSSSWPKTSGSEPENARSNRASPIAWLVNGLRRYPVTVEERVRVSHWAYQDGSFRKNEQKKLEDPPTPADNSNFNIQHPGCRNWAAVA